jgi:PAS domain S-box-containing protein
MSRINALRTNQKLRRDVVSPSCQQEGTINNLEIFLKEEAKRYQLIFEQFPLGLIHFDDRGIIFDCNDKAVKTLGVSKEDLIGCNIFECVRNASQKNAIESAINEGEGSFQGPHAIHFDVRLRAVYKRIVTQGKTLGVIGVFDLIDSPNIRFFP